MRWKTGLLAVLYVALASVAAVALFVYGAVDCYENCRYDVENPRWRDAADAWQWDAILWLGVATAVAAAAFLFAVFRLRPWVAAVFLAVQVGLAVAGGAFVRAAGEIGTSDIVLAAVGLALPGAALLALRAQTRAHARTS